MDKSGQSDAAKTGVLKSRARGVGRLLLGRALPGSVVVVAALTVPEFSVGAGDLAGGKPRTKPLEPALKDAQRLDKTRTSDSKGALAGVRYGGVISIREESQRPPAGLLPSADPVPAPTIAADLPIAASRPVVAAAEAVPVARKARTKAVSAQMTPAASDPLQEAATYAVSVLDKFAQQPGPGTMQAVADELMPDAKPPALAKPKEIDVAASYAAMALDRFAAAPSLNGEPAAEPASFSDFVSDLGQEVADAAEFAVTGAVAEIAGAPGLAAPDFDGVAADQASEGLVPARFAALGMSDAVPALTPPPPAAAPIAVAPVSAPKSAAPPAALAPVAKPQATAVQPGLSTPASSVASNTVPLAFAITSQLTTRVDGKAVGTIDFQQTTAGLSVRLGSIVSVLSDRYDPGEIARITASAASNAYIPLTELQAQGIPISYDPVYDEFNIGKTDTRPKAARKVHIDQISTPERGLGTAAIDQVKR